MAATGTRNSLIAMIPDIDIVRVLIRHEIRSKLESIWIYLLCSLMCLTAILFGNAFAKSFETESVLVSTGPLSSLNAAVLLFLGLVSGLRLAGSLSWEREHHTLDVLLVGPVSYTTIVIAKFSAEVFVLLLVLGVYAAFVFAGQPFGRGVLSVSDGWTLAMWSVHILPIMAFGLLVSACCSTVRTAAITYLALVGLMTSVEVSAIWLAPLSPNDLSLALLFLRSTLESAAPVLDVVSVIAHLFQPVETVLGRGSVTLTTLTTPAVLCLSFIVMSVVISRRRDIT